ncbi:MAG: 4Fe-4S binding protein [Coriobacteriales bacterium]|jgi:ferredoxin|nr:4Fe-4S binding protein [Coriobacteriales bacterium]MDO5709476.1 4Fe-4S binding protein [Coriobacteriales bacterium]
MAEQRDMLDDLIDISENWQALSNPFGSVVDTLTMDPSKVKQWDPGEYKEVPRTNAVTCLQVTAQSDEVCGRCLEVCPTAAIDIKPAPKKVTITEDCRKCGLCSSVCPAGTFLTTRLAAKVLYDRIARVAAAYEQAYVTCTRALGRLPKDNEIVLPCVGAVPRDVWFALLTEYGNLSVYLPLGICDRCRTLTGESVYADHISEAEELSNNSVGLEVDEASLTHEYTRAYKRSQFVGNMARAGMTVATKGVPVLAGAQLVAKRIKDHGQQLMDVQRQIEKAVGAKTDLSKRRVLTQERKLVLAALQKRPELAENFHCKVPVCDWSLCTMCGECAKACPFHACDIDSSGHFSVEPAYCIGCEACMIVCPECCIEMEPSDPQELVIPDENAAKLEERRAELEKRKAAAREQLKKGLDVVERLAVSDE